MFYLIFFSYRVLSVHATSIIFFGKETHLNLTMLIFTLKAVFHSVKALARAEFLELKILRGKI